MEQNTGFSLLKNLKLVYMMLSSRFFFTNYSLTVSFSKFSHSPHIFLSVRVLKGLFRDPNLGSSFYVSIWPPETGQATPSKTIQIMTLLWSHKMRFLSLSLCPQILKCSKQTVNIFYVQKITLILTYWPWTKYNVSSIIYNFSKISNCS